MLQKTGVPTPADLKKKLPSTSRLKQGAVAIIECFQEIPCNPCETACPRGAISFKNDINDIPELDNHKCNGCGVCVSRCPGLAIFVVDMNYSEEKALVKLPWEFIPIPKKGDQVLALDRGGQELDYVEVVQVQSSPALDRTHIISLAVPRALAHEVRSIAIGGEPSE